MKYLKHYDANIPAKLSRISFVEKEGKGGWQALSFRFTCDQGAIFLTKIFSPSTTKDRFKVNNILGHFMRVAGGDYNSIEYQHSFEEFAYEYIKKMERFYGSSFYLKVLPKKYNGKFIGIFGFDLPILSVRPDMEYSDNEIIYIESYEDGDIESDIKSKDLLYDDDFLKTPF